MMEMAKNNHTVHMILENMTATLLPALTKKKTQWNRNWPEETES
jgi:hypothetical protein